MRGKILIVLSMLILGVAVYLFYTQAQSENSQESSGDKNYVGPWSIISENKENEIHNSCSMALRKDRAKIVGDNKWITASIVADDKGYNISVVTSDYGTIKPPYISVSFDENKLFIFRSFSATYEAMGNKNIYVVSAPIPKKQADDLFNAMKGGAKTMKIDAGTLLDIELDKSCRGNQSVYRLHR